MNPPLFRLFSLLAMLVVTATECHSIERQAAQSGQTLALLDMGSGVENRLKPNASNVSVAAAGKGVIVTIKPGKEGYPGVSIKPPLNSWNLSAFGHVEARITNTGAKPVMVALRVDNAGDWQTNPWNTESVTLEPGTSEAITTIFGYSYGHKRGFALKPQSVVNVLLFCLKSDDVQSFRIDSLVAAGPAGEKPPVAPEDVRFKPAAGIVFGVNATLDLAAQLQAKGAQPLIVGTDRQPSLRLLFPISKDDPLVTIKPSIGRWDLSEGIETQIQIRNMGKTAYTPRARMITNGGPSDWVTLDKPLLPGTKAALTIPFKGNAPTVVGKPGTGTVITSDAVGAFELTVDSPESERLLYIDSIQAGMPVKTDIPSWLGERPPVPGEWVKTLDDEFDGTVLDTSLWDMYGENYYDKVTHWSREDVIVGGGVVKLRYEKKVGFGNDDPKRPRTDYAAGYLTTYDKWVQRYGYFEARMKLPKAPGLWPAFWMMPDRGDRSTPQYVRQATENGGMEFDIMEHLTRWGSNRYNISMHYDGYGATHKSVGSDKIYVQPDKDRFITCGLLWTPGSAVFYCNGHEVLRWDDARVCSVPSCFLFTLPAGGWDNNAVEDSQLPADFVIDYVRVWQRKDLASPADGKKAPAVKS